MDALALGPGARHLDDPRDAVTHHPGRVGRAPPPKRRPEPRVDPLPVPDFAPDWTPAELERYLHVVAMEKHSAGSIPRRDVVDQLHAHVGAIGNPNPLLLTGPSGCGKSTALATLVSEIQSKTGEIRGKSERVLGSFAADGGDASASASTSGEPDVYVLTHTFGLPGQSNDFRRVLLRLCFELKSRFNIYVEPPTTLEEAGTALPRFLAHAALFSKIVLVIDGLDKAELKGVEFEDWLPASLPLAVRVFISSAGCRAVNEMRQRSGRLLKEVKIGPLSANERKALMNKWLASVYNGQIDVSKLEKLTQGEDGGNPLFLFVAANEIKQRAKTAESLDALYEEANALPDSVIDLVGGALYERLERRFGTTLVAEASTLIACSRGGLRDDEIEKLLRQAASLSNMPPGTWASLKSELEPYCWPIDRLPGDPVTCFFQHEIATWAIRRYASAGAEKRGQHFRLAVMFSDKNLPPAHRHISEAMWNMELAEEWGGLRCALTDPRVHALLWNEDSQIDLANQWEALLEGERKIYNSRSGMLNPPPMRKRRDVVAEYDLQADKSPPSADGLITPDVYKELLADFLMWAGFPGDAAFILRMLSEAKGDAADLAAVSVNFKLGRALSRQGLHLEAEETLRRALAAEQLLVGSETPMVAEIAGELCKVKREEGDHEQAGQLAAHAVSVWEAAEAAWYEEADVTTLVEALVRLSDVCEELNRGSPAEAALERALERLEYMLGPDHPEVAQHLGKMAASYKAHGEWEKSEFCYQRALDFAHRFTGPQSLHISHFYNALAELHRARGDLPHAQALYQRALLVIESVLGTSHPEVATYLNNIAELLRVQGRLQEAEPMYKRALAIDESAQGVTHPIIAIRLNNLAELFRDQRRLQEAEPLYQRALAIDMAALGSTHPNIATYLNNLAGLYKAKEMWDHAIEHYERAIAIDEAALGADHPDVAIYLNNLAGLYKARGELDKAEPLYLRALRINEDALGADHTDMAIYFNNLALLYKAQGKLQDARLYYEQAIEIGKKTLGPEHPQLATRMSNLGALLVDVGDLDEAHILFSAALEIREKALGEAHPDSQNCRDWLDTISDMREDAGLDGVVVADPKKDDANDEEARRKAAEDAIAAVEAAQEAEMAAAEAEAKEAAEREAAEEAFKAKRRVSDFQNAAAVAAERAKAKAEETETPAEAQEISEPALPESPGRAEREAAAAAEAAAALASPPKDWEVMNADVEAAAGAVDAAQASIDGVLAALTAKANPLHVALSPLNTPANISAAVVRSATPLSAHAGSFSSSPETSPRPPPIDVAPAVVEPLAEALAKASAPSPPREDDEEEARADADADAAPGPGLAESALDAFLSAHVEYLGNRQYRCVLDGKTLSKFSIMRVHVAKKFGGLVHQWAMDQALVGDGHPGPAAAYRSPLNARAKPAAEGGAENATPPPVPNAAAAAAAAAATSRAFDVESSAEAHSNAIKRVEELEEELARLRTLVVSGEATPTPTPTPTPTVPAATPSERGVLGEVTNAAATSEPPRDAPSKIPVAVPVPAYAYQPPPPPPQMYGMHGSPSVPPPPQYGYPHWQQPPPPPPMYGTRGGSPPPAPAPYPPYEYQYPAAGGWSSSDHALSVYAAAAAVEAAYRPDARGRARARHRGRPSSPDERDDDDRRGGGRFGSSDPRAANDALRRRAPHEPQYPYPRGSDFSDMLRRERGPDPFAAYLPARGGGRRGGGGGGGSDDDDDDDASDDDGFGFGKDAAGRLANFTSPTRRAQEQITKIIGTGKGSDRLSLFMSARSQQLGRRKFLCDIDGRTFSTMNLLRAHFERNYVEDADAWWRKQVGGRR